MADEAPAAGSKWVHKREGYPVLVAAPSHMAFKVKDAGDANWRNGVAYFRGGDDTCAFVRSREDFLEKFELELQDEGDA